MYAAHVQGGRGFASEGVPWHPHPALHEHAGAAAHDGFGHRPLAINLLGLGTDTQRARGMAKAHCLARAATRGLGFMVQSAGEFLATDVVLAGIAVIAIIAFGLELGLRALQRRLTPWHGEVQ